MELAARIELATSSLLVKRSATELSEPSIKSAFGGNRTPANCLEGSYDTISPRTLKIICFGPGRESNSGLPHPKRKFYH